MIRKLLKKINQCFYWICNFDFDFWNYLFHWTIAYALGFLNADPFFGFLYNYFSFIRILFHSTLPGVNSVTGTFYTFYSCFFDFLLGYFRSNTWPLIAADRPGNQINESIYYRQQKSNVLFFKTKEKHNQGLSFLLHYFKNVSLTFP